MDDSACFFYDSVCGGGCFSGGLSRARAVFGLTLQGALHGLQKSLLWEKRRGLRQGQVASQPPLQLLLDSVEG